MIKQLVFYVGLTLLIIACQSKQETIQTKKASNELTDSLTIALNEITKQGYINGFAVASVNETGVQYAQGFGWADKEKGIKYTEQTLQHIASVSKVFVGVALLKAQEQGKLKLDDPINQHLPFQVVNPHFPNEEITIRHLATHTSSIEDSKAYMEKAWVLKADQDLTQVMKQYPDSLEMQYFNDAETMLSMEEFLKKVLLPKGEWYVKEGFSTHKPGERYSYSNVATALAGLVLEKATGVSFEQFTQTHIFDPLEMKDSGWNFESIDFSKHARLYADINTPLPFYRIMTPPDGGLISSASDMSKFLAEMLNGFLGNGTLLSKESYQELFTARLTPENFDERNEGHWYNSSYNVGTFMGITPKGFVGHDGGDAGVIAYFFIHPETKTGSYLIANMDLGDGGIGQFYAIWKTLVEYESKLKDH